MTALLISGAALGIAFIAYAIDPRYQSRPAPVGLTVTAAAWAFVTIGCVF